MSKKLSDGPRVILIELNEVPWRVIDLFCQQEPESALARLIPKSTQLTTRCADEVELDPWISWPTLHRGVNDNRHRIIRLGQPLTRVDEEFPPIWRILAENKKSVGVFGSLHSGNLPDNMSNYSFYIPDYFEDSGFASPDYLRPFQRFNIAMTRKSSRNVDTGLPKALMFELIKSLPRLGISISTGLAIARQFLLERSTPRLRLRRRSLQAQLMGDIFVEQVTQTRPLFATFYTNHVAAAMHRYWAATFPKDYDELVVSDKWIDDYKSELIEAMKTFDIILRKIYAHCNINNAILVIASSMGQEAVVRRKAQNFLTITNIYSFMSMLGFSPEEFAVKSAMVPGIGLVLSRERAVELTEKLDRVSIDGCPFVGGDVEILPLSYCADGTGFVSILSCFNGYEGPDEVVFEDRSWRFDDVGVGVVDHEDGVSVTAHHIPEGVLLVYDPASTQPNGLRNSVSTTEIAPAILRFLGVLPPAYMDEPTGLVTAALSQT